MESTASSVKNEDSDNTNTSTVQIGYINSLPNEVIIIILKNVPLYDRMSFGMTCKRMHNLFNSTPILHKDKLVKIGGDKNYEMFISLFTSETNESISHIIVPNIEFKDCENVVFTENFWHLYGKHVTSINFEHCENFYNDDTLRNIFSLCPNLEEIEIDHFKELTNLLNKCSLLKYEKLKKIVTSSLSDFAFNNFIANAPKLKCLSCKDLHFIEQEGNPNKRMRIEGEENKILLHENLNTGNITYENIMKALPLSNITSLCVRDIYTFPSRKDKSKNREYTCDEIKHICKLKEFGFKLEELFIDYSCKDRTVKDAFETLINTYGDYLKYLNITDVPYDVFGLSIMPDVSKFINLKTLILSERLTIENNFMGISYLKNLETLHFGYYPSLDDDWPTKPNNGIKIYNVLKELPNIRRLFIKGADLNKFDLYLKGKSIGLIELHLEEWVRMKIKETLVALYENHKTLRKLTLICKKSFIIDEYFSSGQIIKPNKKSVAKHYDGLSALKNLEYLMIVCTKITSKCIMEEFKWNELKTLKLVRHKHITDDALLSISKNCPILTELSLSGCKSITDEGIKHLCNLTRLRKINLEGTKVTAVGLNYLIESSCPLSECIIDKILENDENQQEIVQKLKKKLNYKEFNSLTLSRIYSNKIHL